MPLECGPSGVPLQVRRRGLPESDSAAAVVAVDSEERDCGRRFGRRSTFLRANHTLAGI